MTLTRDQIADFAAEFIEVACISRYAVNEPLPFVVAQIKNQIEVANSLGVKKLYRDTQATGETGYANECRLWLRLRNLKSLNIGSDMFPRQDHGRIGPLEEFEI